MSPDLTLPLSFVYANKNIYISLKILKFTPQKVIAKIILGFSSLFCMPFVFKPHVVSISDEI
jgi:hypothetical protein